LRVLKTSGVVQFVGNRRGAVSTTDKEITDVRAVLDQKLGCSSYPFLQLFRSTTVMPAQLAMGSTSKL
jgi:hypothetical protein